ncbi:MAG TPA: hypothetical protein VJ935_02330 [Acidimicrobiia bacterium]|nr:hypothetical protein [Acidimicrobiia bacterium]
MRVVRFLLVLLLAACGGSQADVTTGASPAGGAESQTSAAVATTSGPALATPTSSAAPAANYTEGAATATVDIDGTVYEFAEGTCSAEASTVYTFELISGQFDEEPYFSVYFLNMSGPVTDGEYPTGISLVTINVAGEDYLVGEGGSLTITDGVTRGEFSGPNQSPANPASISGSFTC